MRLGHVGDGKFEQICREFAIATPTDTFGGLPAEVGAGVITDPASRTRMEVNVVVLAPADPGEPRRVLSLGEAKWGEIMGIRQVERLRRARDLLAARGFNTRDTVIACYSDAGFDPELHDTTDRLLTVGLEDLYADGD
ncbi:MULTISPECIES: hypothetical protein [Protofrankia]|uniref:hypothetical protein n=1 Tax=Protofrankia TaxID=2994361 RepID=UPI00069A5874|nr:MULTISPECIES: hypothetical protein [Protofrankia]ONH36469.1 hypothetical protein BL254_06805 [Protofrankia sp. BMG5.30]